MTATSAIDAERAGPTEKEKDMPHEVDMETCTSCGLCLKVCPNKAISHKGRIFKIDVKLCKDCAGVFDEPQCVDVCKSGSCVPIAA